MWHPYFSLSPGPHSTSSFKLEAHSQVQTTSVRLLCSVPVSPPCCSWPGTVLCRQQVLLLHDFAYEDRFAWSLPPKLTRPAAKAVHFAATANTTNTSADGDSKVLPAALVKQLGPGYNATLPVHYINSTWLCEHPSAGCVQQPNSNTQKACLLLAYTRINPDVLATAAAGGSGGSYGVRVVLPAVLASVGE